jgi:exonuclease III
MLFLFSTPSGGAMFIFAALLICVSGAVAPDPGDRELSIVSWNVNGVRKFRHLPNEVAFIASHDIVLLQETFSREGGELLELRGFYSHHQRALPRSGGRNIWGLSSFFKTTAFTDGFWSKVYSAADWLLISRWKSPGRAAGIMVLNVYIPIHTSGFASHDVSLLRTTTEDLLSQFPGDFFILGGDFNLDCFGDSLTTTSSTK